MSTQEIPGYIVVEGLPRAGKTTQTKALGSYLHRLIPDRQISTVERRGLLQSQIVNVLHTHASDMDERAEFLLTMAAKMALVQYEVQPIVAAGGIAIVDESVYGALACLGYGQEFNTHLTASVVPGLLFLLDISPEESLLRAGNSNVVGDVEYLARVRKGFLEIADQMPNVIRVVDGNGTIDEVSKRMWKLL